MWTNLSQLSEKILPNAGGMGLSPLVLRFHQARVEQAYQDYYHQHSQFQTRLATVVGMITLAMFSIVDVLYSPLPQGLILVGLRVIVGWGAFLLFLGLTYSRYSRQYTRYGLLILIVFIGFVVMVMIPIAAKPIGYHYYVGIILTLIFYYIFLRAQFLYTLFAGGILTISYLILSVYWFRPPQSLLVISNMFMFSANFVGLIASYNLDYYWRREFLLRRKLEEAHRDIAHQSAVIAYEKERIEAIFNNNSDAVVLVDKLGVITEANAAFSLNFAGQPDNFLGQDLGSLVVDSCVESVTDAIETVLRDQQGCTIDVVALREDGSTFDASAAFSPMLVKGDSPAGIVCSLRDISTRKRMERQLQQALEHEAEIAHMRSRFISMASHDLRNPLAVIKSSIFLLSHYSDKLSEEKKRAQYDQIHTSISIMVDMLNDVLTVGKLEANKLEFAPELFDIRDFCQTLVDEASIITGSGQEIAFACSGSCRAVMLDQKLVRHIVSNLLSNAIKYSLDDSTVVFDMQVEEHQVTLRIQDHGIGIPQADQKRLYETFFRASNVGPVSGTGLGLAIVKQSVDLHGGTITFESAEARGTTVTVTLPCASSEPDV